jgi:transketolase
MREIFIKELLNYAKSDPNIYLLTGDLGFGILKPFWDELPKQIMNLGIAEQNLLGFSAGLAKSGKKVFVYSIGNFPSLRPLEQIRNDIAYHDLDVKIVSVGAGFSYGSLGFSHHATEDISIIRSLPNMKVFNPSDSNEVRSILKFIIQDNHPCYLRLDRSDDTFHKKVIQDFTLGVPINLLKGQKVVFFSTGSILGEVLKIIPRFTNKFGFTPSIYSCPTIKPLNVDEINRILKNFDYLVTFEEHNLHGGFGSSILEVINFNRSNNLRILRIGIEDSYSYLVGDQNYQRKAFGLNSESIFEKISALING